MKRYLMFVGIFIILMAVFIDATAGTTATKIKCNELKNRVVSVGAYSANTEIVDEQLSRQCASAENDPGYSYVAVIVGVMFIVGAYIIGKP